MNRRMSRFLKIGLCLFALIISQTSYAKVVDVFFCAPLYQNVEKVFLSYDQDIPDGKSINWPNIMHGISDRSAKMLEENSSITFDITDASKEEILKKYPRSLYINLVYSYADKNKFSIELPSSQMAAWIETSKYDEDLKKIVTDTSKSSVWSVDDNIKIDHLTLKSIVHGSIPNAVCNVLRYSAQKRCTDVTNLGKNEVVPYTRECVNSDEYFKDDEVYQFLKENSE